MQRNKKEVVGYEPDNHKLEEMNVEVQINPFLRGQNVKQLTQGA